MHVLFKSKVAVKHILKDYESQYIEAILPTKKKKKQIKARISSEIFLSLARPSAVYPQKYTMY